MEADALNSTFLCMYSKSYYFWLGLYKAEILGFVLFGKEEYDA